jgi:hypothetical protein
MFSKSDIQIGKSSKGQLKNQLATPALSDKQNTKSKPSAEIISIFILTNKDAVDSTEH